VIGIDLGEVESEAFWTEFLRSPRSRGLMGLRLVVSDHHEGLKTAIARILDAPWQRCCVHFVRNMHGHYRPAQRGMVSAALREVFNAPAQPEARRRVTALIQRLADQVPRVCELLEAAEDDLLAFMAFPEAHWSKLRSTDERFKGRGASTGCSVGVSLGGGRGRPPSEAQVLGLRPAAQLLPRPHAIYQVTPGHPRPATSDTTKGSQADRPTASKRVSSPPVGTISSASDVTDHRIQTASLEATAGLCARERRDAVRISASLPSPHGEPACTTVGRGSG
jgi:hypothetical protein